MRVGKVGTYTALRDRLDGSLAFRAVFTGDESGRGSVDDAGEDGDDGDGELHFGGLWRG